MSEDIHHECGVAALSRLGRSGQSVTEALPGILLDLQTRGQLAAGMSSFDPERPQILGTYKDVGSVDEVFRMSRPEKLESILQEYEGRACIGHTRYATSGADDVRYAQPFERHHGRRWKWFSFAFNGTLSNYGQLRDRLLSKQDYHFSLDIDTEIIMHSLAYHLRGESAPDLVEVMRALSVDFDGAYCLVFLDAMGRLFVARDPLGVRPMHWAVEGDLFGAANESVALRNAGFPDVVALEPGTMVIIEDGKMRVERYADVRPSARCFFEWVYFSNVASEIDGAGVYESRAAAGQRLAEMEQQPIDEDCLVVPVPDTAKAAADAFAYALGVPCMEGIVRNRYVGRTFIQPEATRGASARSKYTALPTVLAGKRVFLVEDSIVRSTTLRRLAKQLRDLGTIREIHVRVACPPIVAPCFYGIDMSTLGELLAPQFLDETYDGEAKPGDLAEIARALDIDSLAYLPVPQLAPTIGVERDSLCLGCVTGRYPTKHGNELFARAKRYQAEGHRGRTYG